MKVEELKEIMNNSQSEEVVRAEEEMKGKNLHERWGIAEKCVFDIVKDVKKYDDNELKQIYSAFFKRFDAVKLLGGLPLSVLKEDNPEMKPVSVMTNDPLEQGLSVENTLIDVIGVPYYVNGVFLEKEIERLKEEVEEWQFEELLDRLPFEWDDDFEVISIQV